MIRKIYTQSCYANETSVYETQLISGVVYLRFILYRLKQSGRRVSQSVFCSGGDNNHGLVLSAAEESAQRFAVNESIVGRPSRGFIAKVCLKEEMQIRL